MAVIEVKDLAKSFQVPLREPGFAGALRGLWAPQYRTVDAVAGVSFTVEEGEILSFIGPNGAGKSTTLKMLTGILHPSGGEARVMGRVPWVERQELVRHIGAVFGQKSQLWYHLPPEDTFYLLSKVYEIEPAVYRHRLGELVERFELKEFLRTPTRKLSLGQRMRAEIAASLLHRPRVLFLDEPTIGLDVVAKAAIRDLILEINREDRVSLILTSHDVSDMERLSRRVVVIHHGRKVLDTLVQSLKRDHVTRKIVSLRVREPDLIPEIPGTEVLKRKGPGLKLGVDLSLTTIEEVISRIIATAGIADVNIASPPLEEIIAGIYSARKDESAPAPAPASAPAAAPAEGDGPA